jgi:hypothetical protein
LCGRDGQFEDFADEVGHDRTAPAALWLEVP